ncbi:ATP-binding protein [Kitasatospora sp. NPDC018058]|uniref:ATP-binding protein n=1 Tax=Kitasatospora sp. NPDC018058 TaxID=3364025 RepID=UPI0037C1B3EC
MTEPQRLGSADSVAALQARLGRLGIPLPERGPIDDTPSPDEPGHPEYHRRARAEFALARWETAVPRRYANAAPIAADPAVGAWAQQVAKDPTKARSLLLTGTTGTGKTHQAWAALRMIAEAGPARYELIATTAADMYGRLRPGGSDAGTETALNRLARVPLLLLDDLGSAKASEWVEEITYRLINERYNACRPTVFTSNYPTEAPRDPKTGAIVGPGLDVILGDRIVSRLMEMTDVVVMTGRDRRRRAA